MTSASSPALETWRRWSDAPLLAIAIGSLPLLVLEVFGPELPVGDERLLRLVSVVILIAFAADLVVEHAIVRRLRVRDQWDTVLVVIAQSLSLVASAGGAAGAIRVVRPLVQVIRTAAIGGAAARNIRRQFHEHPATLALSAASVVWITSAVAFTFLEQLGRKDFDSFTDALWWSATTITTVGYGDISPETGPGRIVAVITMIAGISTFAVVTGKIAQFLVHDEPA